MGHFETSENENQSNFESQKSINWSKLAKFAFRNKQKSNLKGFKKKIIQ